MSNKLTEIANLILGFTFREALIQNPHGNARVFQAKNIGNNINDINLNNLIRISFSGSYGNYFLKKNDIVITLRGIGIGSFRAAVINDNINDTVAASSVLIIRIINRSYLPEYVAAYLNSTRCQKNILETVAGSYIPTISKKNIGEIKIPKLDQENQDLIVKLVDNLNQQSKICEKRIRLQKNIANSIFENL